MQVTFKDKTIMGIRKVRYEYRFIGRNPGYHFYSFLPVPLMT
jgi:hypothetical protein